jgi:hypothetical protein
MVYPDPKKDAEHLKILSICWYIVAALQALGGCVGLIYVGLGVLFGLGGLSTGRGDDAAAGGIFGGFFACIGIFILLLTWGIAFLNFKVGRSLVTRKHPTLCMVMAIILCLFVPLGTLLGVFTLIVLSRPTVKASFT